MSKIQFSRKGKILLSVALAVALLAVSAAALAQIAAQNTEQGGTNVESPGSFSAQLNVPALQSGEDGTEANGAAPAQQGDYVPGMAPDDNLPVTSSSAASSPNAPAAPPFRYYFVPGTTLRPRSSTTGYAYDQLGCNYATSGSGINTILNTELHLPDNATIKYLRVIYKDTNNPGFVSGYITRYKPGVATNDLISVSSTAAFAGGVGFAVSNEITHTVDNVDYAYTLIGWPSAAASSLEICGLRVAYWAPNFYPIFLPVIK
jgi:hypothetical protein